MRTIPVLLLLCVAAITPAEAAPRAGGVTAADNHGIAAILPKDWVLQPPEPNLNGTRFVSRAGDAWLALYKLPAGKGAAGLRKPVTGAEGEEITYMRRGRDWVVISGYRKDRIFYRRAMLACRNADWHHIHFEYPAAKKRAYDRLVTRTSHALQLHKNDGCA